MVSLSKNNLFEGFERECFPRTYQFLESQNLSQTQRIPSRWRADNLVFRAFCELEEYVVKKINDPDSSGEIEKVKLIRMIYPQLTPRVYLIEGSDCYTMDNIRGKSFFEIKKEERVAQIKRAGIVLSEAYASVTDAKKLDISQEVRKSFERYREKRKQYFKADELRPWQIDFDRFRQVPNKPSHNDLNAANLLYNGEIKLIDPSEEGFNDVARDVGRYAASCFFNNYDYFGNDRMHSLQIADAFLGSFDEETLDRARYYMGESFLSFLRFDTITTDKGVLKKLAVNLLTKRGRIINLLEESL
jgi:thiamine kinase-like enzyme